MKEKKWENTPSAPLPIPPSYPEPFHPVLTFVQASSLGSLVLYPVRRASNQGETLQTSFLIPPEAGGGQPPASLLNVNLVCCCPRSPPRVRVPRACTFPRCRQCVRYCSFNVLSLEQVPPLMLGETMRKIIILGGFFWFKKKKKRKKVIPSKAFSKEKMGGARGGCLC